jgi:hypothetical protein
MEGNIKIFKSFFIGIFIKHLDPKKSKDLKSLSIL